MAILLMLEPLKPNSSGDRPSHYVRDDRPFGGADPPAALYFASRDRLQQHPDSLYDPARKAEVVTSALCWARARRVFFELADIATSARRGPSAAPISPIALETTKRIDALFEIERAINGLSAEDRRRVKRTALSRSSSAAKPIDYMLKRWSRFADFLDDGPSA